MSLTQDCCSKVSQAKVTGENYRIKSTVAKSKSKWIKVVATKTLQKNPHKTSKLKLETSNTIHLK